MSLPEIVENFKLVMDEMQGKVAAIRERMDEVYKKLNQLEVQKCSLVSSNDHLNRELHKLSSQVALIENPGLPRERDQPGKADPLDGPQED